jgi:hypothetical protein
MTGPMRDAGSVARRCRLGFTRARSERLSRCVIGLSVCRRMVPGRGGCATAGTSLMQLRRFFRAYLRRENACYGGVKKCRYSDMPRVSTRDQDLAAQGAELIAAGCAKVPNLRKRPGRASTYLVRFTPDGHRQRRHPESSISRLGSIT